MASEQLIEILKRSETLTLDEQLELIARLAAQARDSQQPSSGGRSWSEARGLAPYPLLGEDAQAYLTRSRQSDTDDRERGWQNTK
jgi:hypothetical protein